MTTAYFISDMHFGHENICKFMNPDGSKLRPFDSAAEMDEAIIKNWNSVVNSADRVYVLGDVAMKRTSIPTIARCNGRKVLVPGNHDIYEAKDYLKYFEDVRGVYVLPSRDGILSHIPLHLDSVARFKVNVHGHTHNNNLPDPHYFSVCVENINYTPISRDELKVKIQQKREMLGYV